MEANINKIEKVVRPHIRTDNLIDVCTEDGELIITVSEIQWFSFLKPIKVDNKSIYRFIRKSEDEEYYVYSVNVKKLNQIIEINKGKMIKLIIPHKYELTSASISTEFENSSDFKINQIKRLIEVASERTSMLNGMNIPIRIDIVDTRVLFMVTYETDNSIVEIKTLKYKSFKSDTSIMIKHKFDDDAMYNTFRSDVDMTPQTDFTDIETKDDVININIAMDIVNFLKACLSYINKTELRNYETS